MESERQETYQIVKFEASLPFFFRVHRRTVQNSIRSAMVLEHWHKGLEVNYVVEGPTDYMVDGISRPFGKGDICIINSGSIHSINKHITLLDGAIDAFTVIIDYEFLRLLVPDYDNITFTLKEEGKAALRECMDRLLECYLKSDSHYRDIALTGIVYELVFLLCENCKEEKSPVEIKSQRHIQQIYRIMDDVKEHYQEQVTQAEVAARLGFSREHFSRFFKQYTGITYLEYLTRYRIDKAKQLLEATNLTEIEIALDSGFSSVKQMSSAFKKYLSMTPSQFRRSLVS